MTWMLCDCGDGVKTWFMPTSKATMNAMRTKASENVITFDQWLEFRKLGGSVWLRNLLKNSMENRKSQQQEKT
jgi:hypothetical protein